MKRNKGISCKTRTDDFSDSPFYFTLLSVRGWLKTKRNVELYILGGRLIEVKTIGEALSGLPKGGRGRLIEVAAK